MSMLTQSAPAPTAGGKKKPSFAESQRLAKQKSYEKSAKRKKIKLDALTVFTQQISSMLQAGLPLVGALEALQDQTEDPVFKIIIRDVRNDIAGGTAFSDAVRKFPKAFPNLFISMVEAGEASGALADIMGKVALYFEDSLKLIKKVKSAMTYPIAVIGLAVILVNVLLIFVIPVFSEMFADFGAELPKPTQLLIDLSDFLKSYIIFLIAGGVAAWWALGKITATPKGRRAKDVFFSKLPIIGNLTQKVNISRFCRTYAILLKSGVPILRALEICSSASNNTYVETACSDIIKHISQGGQLSEVLAATPYFPSMVKHMAKAGEQTGNVDGMMNKIADFYDTEVDNIVESLTSLMEPILICVLGVVIGGIVMAMFLPIFQLSSVVG
ncbi:type II secretion system F family protein [Rubellicoccus peritrichatus]|uniref:Type II secretion system F family protein n=1 Tax=Rubellicoccus peritrichatus TaxID=3080537 RepID=A0AAQ3LFB5_9BACT|nr:type II secretion system F family protein [Puniceicoccus sp. CR14]WOO40939.1 type II secretion system F family protein [Puniceicoccus sp. CR14]